MFFTFNNWTFNAAHVLALSPVRRAAIIVQGVRIEREGFAFSLHTVSNRPFEFEYATEAEAAMARGAILKAWTKNAVA
jgi:hypothetical protein